MDNLAKTLKPITVNLDQLLLDPNNPRFSELGEGYSDVQEGRYADPKVQQSAYDKMRSKTFNVAELRDTIKTIGFLQMDRIVVRNWDGEADEKKYVVIEGNRRITALKWLMQLHEVGKETFEEEDLNNFTKIDCLLLDREIAPDAAHLILPGLRHVSGIKEWGPYQKAKAVFALRETGLSPQEAAQSLGLSTRAANNSYRCFVALENLKDDDEFGEFAQPNMYSYFEEVFKKPQVKNWLQWADDAEEFENSENLREFYTWMVGPTDGEDEPHKLPEAKSVRDLAQIIDDDNALAVLRTNEGTLARAIARYEQDHPEDWYPKITAATAALGTLTPAMLKAMDDVTLKSLLDLRDQITESLDDRDKLRSEG